MGGWTGVVLACTRALADAVAGAAEPDPAARKSVAELLVRTIEDAMFDDGEGETDGHEVDDVADAEQGGHAANGSSGGQSRPVTDEPRIAAGSSGTSSRTDSGATADAVVTSEPPEGGEVESGAAENAAVAALALANLVGRRARVAVAASRVLVGAAASLGWAPPAGGPPGGAIGDESLALRSSLVGGAAGLWESLSAAGLSTPGDVVSIGEDALRRVAGAVTGSKRWQTRFGSCFGEGALTPGFAACAASALLKAAAEELGRHRQEWLRWEVSPLLA